MNEFYRRHLPRWVPGNRPVFLTWNLEGAIPRFAQERIRAERIAFSRIPQTLDPEEKRIGEAATAFRIAEKWLDEASSGPKFLGEARSARIVQETILAGARRWYDLFAFAVMANHVHLLITPQVELHRIAGGIKKRSARLINQALNRQGFPLWQDESFDHWPRDHAKFMKSLEYIEQNPVKARICARPEDYAWSSASMRKGWPKGEPYRPPDA